MHYLFRFSCLCIAFFAVFTGTSQSYAVEFKDDQAAADFISESRNAILDIKKIGRSTSMYNVYANALKEHELVDLFNSSNVLQYEKNRKVYTREIPNDENYGSQWPLPLIQAEKVWDLVEHGKTYDDREIVIAILDDSYQITHPDLINNIWTNNAEIPNDGIDNDQNGYIDDYYGLHVDTRNDEHPLGSHGTKVAGIIGAEGNNTIGIAGVNWKIKLMIVSGANNTVDIIEGYNYVLEQRKLYNETNGEEGAFVVATNFSAGISEVFGSEFPMWCGMYDKLGEHGIVSVTAVDNANYDVDVLGDMPTTCQSEFLITTTSTTRFDNKAMFSAFGQTNVDLGAPGDDTFSTTNGDGYAEFTGTSAATPHVAGAIGLLYAANCPLLIETALTDPVAATRITKEAILNSVEPLSGLSGRTASGGRLDLFNAMTALAEICAGTLSSREQLAFSSIGPNPVIDNILLEYDFKNFKDHDLSIYNSIGQLIYKEKVTPSLFTTSEVQIDASTLIQGMYILTFSDGDNQINWKFFKN